MAPLDPDLCYAAASSRDARFDGRFIVAVRTTGIYCRPSCPAVTPKRTNVEFHHTAASAQQSGFRACKRCHPDATPGSPEWNVRHDVVARAMRLIADGVIERDGVGGVATRLGYSERHLNRLVTDEVGAGPLAIARAQRAQTSRVLIETTDLALTDVAFAAGFGSVRQFNDTIREVFDATPSALRSAGRTRRPADADAGSSATVTLKLPTRLPFAGTDVLEFLGRRMIPGVETCDRVDGIQRYRRTLSLPGGDGAVSLTTDNDCDHVVARLRVDDWADLTTAVQRVRRMLDLDADPAAVDDHLGADRVLGPMVQATPGRRSPASVDPFETLVRAIIGQQISVSGARTVAAKLVRATGTTVDPALVASWSDLCVSFPSPDVVADAPDDAFSMPTARRDTIRRAAAAVANGDLVLDVGVDPSEARAKMLELRGIGPWTADYVLMRGLGHPDVMLGTDLGVVHALRRIGSTPDTTTWAPWRSYAVHHLWAQPTEPVTPSRKDRP
ncbi:DNA-3-methyladenine glycosylase 2 family protein [Ilumatobacter nonamiensis]|uniref:DNA-3-methyladenine glycosylase 2 family protein n=1 Tax=Ilumatobacter nonamiensis TaxID=467093 RepID=UPI000346C54D|nr:DNA-3-methyladenine glycosylase 2 family protein [Ilumatobacter nonamiensis]